MNRPQGRWLRFVYKRIVAGDIRKLSAESADAGTGGGARDLRFNPAEKFWPVFERMFSAAATKKYLDARLIWDGEITTTEVYPPTSARPNEARITRVNACCPAKLIPPDNEVFIFILIQGEDGVHASFMTKQQVLDNRFSLELENVLIRAIEYSETTKVPVGFSDLENHVQYSSIGDVMNMAMFHPYLVREDILAAIRTKPFILLAGISGTGKSRMVRQLARGLCPRYKKGSSTEDHPLYNEQKPGNFEIIPVRPNWHDSTELMGYVTRISNDNKPKYILTPFVRFLVKAWLHPDVPFFLCLDEMNLAPVEQYFAEYLSAIESRKKDSAGKITTDVLVRFDVAQIDDDTDKFVKATVDALLKDYKPAAGSPVDASVTGLEGKMLADRGLRIPPNLVVMGTVNMDETTCTFSRKVLDRAMSFELNDVSDMYDPAKLAGEGDYEFGSIDAEVAKGTLLTGKEAYDSAGGQSVAITDAAGNKKVGEAILAFLETLNEKEAPAKKADGTDGSGTMPLLAKTPFKIAYRSRNEIMIYCIERTVGNIVPLPQALDEVLSMKVLSRIEGDSQHVRPEWLQTLSAAIVDGLSNLDGYDVAKCVICKDKLADMVEQAQYGYTSFWMR
jgi:hypothetical protein